jgi:hypothetical protein
VFPVAEVLMVNVLVLPLSMAATVLLLQRGNSGRQALGAVGMALLLGYIALVVAVLLAVKARQKMDWLRYMPHEPHEPDRAGPKGCGGIAADGLQSTGAGRACCGADPTQNLASGGLTAAASDAKDVGQQQGPGHA